MRDYKINSYRKTAKVDPIVLAFLSLVLAYVVVGMSWSQFGF